MLRCVPVADSRNSAQHDGVVFGALREERRRAHRCLRRVAEDGTRVECSTRSMRRRARSVRSRQRRGVIPAWGSAPGFTHPHGERWKRVPTARPWIALSALAPWMPHSWGAAPGWNDVAPLALNTRGVPLVMRAARDSTRREVRLGAIPKPTRGTRALPGARSRALVQFVTKLASALAARRTSGRDFTSSFTASVWMPAGNSGARSAVTVSGAPSR